MNDERDVSHVLLDRMNLMRMEKLTHDDKVNICKLFLLPRELARVGVDKEELTLSDAAFDALVTQHAHERGVRSLARAIRKLVETLNVMGHGGQQYLSDVKVSSTAFPIHCSSKMANEILGEADATGRTSCAPPCGMYT